MRFIHPHKHPIIEYKIYIYTHTHNANRMYVPCIVAGIIPCMPFKDINTPSTIACGIAV